MAGIVLGDVRAPYKAEIERFHSSLASLAEIIGVRRVGPDLSPSPTGPPRGHLADRADPGGPLLALVVWSSLVGLVLLPVDLTRGERVFVLWAGLKGAVPILLGTWHPYVGSPVYAERLYGTVVVVVAFSVWLCRAAWCRWWPIVRASLCAVPSRSLVPGHAVP